MPRKTNSAANKPAAAAASSALTAPPDTLPRAQVMQRKGYSNEQLFKLALTKAGLDPRAQDIPIATLERLPVYEAPLETPPPEPLPAAELPPVVTSAVDGTTPVPRIVALQLIGITEPELARELENQNLDPNAEILDMATVSAIYEAHSLKRPDALEYLGIEDAQLSQALEQIEENPKAKTLTLATIERLESLPTETLLQEQATAMRTAMDTAQERQLAYYRDMAEQLQATAETAALTVAAQSARTFHDTLAEAFDALSGTSAGLQTQLQQDFLDNCTQTSDERPPHETPLGKARRSSFKGSRKTTHTRKTAQQIFQTALKP